jgi:hypothetical protein
MNSVLQKVNKILLVIFITFLIWVWADLALEEKVEGVAAVIEVKEMPSQDIWVTLESKTRLEVRMTLSGPHAPIADLRRQMRPGGEPLAFSFDARQLGFAQPGKRSIDLVQFLQGQSELKGRGLDVVAVEPATAEVTVVPLEPKLLRVKLLDNNGLEILDYEKIEPDQITVPVPADWSGDKLVAFVQLSPTSETAARQKAIERTPQIELAPGIKKDADRTVTIKLRSEQLLKPKTISPVIGYAFSANLQGQYRVDINDEDLAKAMNGISYSATDAAETAFKAMPYQLLLMVEEKDKTATGLITRRLIYNFPLESVEKDEIKPLSPAPEVRFKLVPVTSTAPTAAPGTLIPTP